MDNRGELQRKMIMELMQGEECAKQLQRMLELASAQPPLSSMASQEAGRLVKKVLSSFAVALSLLNPGESLSSPMVTESPLSVSSSPSSKAYHKHSGNPFAEQGRRKVSKKRKTLPKWTEQVTLKTDAGAEGIMEDGYSWRKYGQKDILGAAHPKGYYRCTHKFTQGCEATKHVQKSDDNPSVFNITYLGNHTCKEPIYPSQATDFHNTPENLHSFNHTQNFQTELLLNFKTGLKVKTEDLDAKSATGFSFPLTPDNQHQQQQSLDPPMMLVSPAFFSPIATSDSNGNIFAVDMDLHHQHNSESDFDIISAETSAANSPIPGFELLESLYLDPDLPFDIGQFFQSGINHGGSSFSQQ